MSWARVDDGLWAHPKFEEMRLNGEYTAIALWVLALSYCGQKQNPRITIQEAAMLLCCSLADAESAMNVLRSRGLADPDSATKQTPSSLLHDWECYRSKNEAKVWAGRKGGETRAENIRKARLAESKQSPSRTVSLAKQSPSPVPVPVPVPVPYSATRSATEAAKRTDIDEVWSHWRLRFPSVRREKLQAGSAEYKLIKKRLAQYSVADLCLAIDGMLKDEWSVANNCVIGWALRQDDKHQNIDKFIALAEGTTRAAESTMMPYHLPIEENIRRAEESERRWLAAHPEEVKSV